jgi:hypothetical protein
LFYYAASSPTWREKFKKLISICANTKSAFTSIERFVGNYAVDQKPEQLSVRLKVINEKWEKYNKAQDELEELVISVIINSCGVKCKKDTDT